MIKLKFLTIAAGLVVGLTLALQPTTAEGAEVNSHPISDDSEMKLMAFETGVNLHIPSTIRGINTNPAISLSFSGDRNGSNQYRWTFVPGDGGRTQTGATGATSRSISHTYSLINRDHAVYSVQGSATGYSHATSRKSVTHRR